ncbi:CASTOR/POLLUX-related putative ion channel [Streptomyces sp. NBC_01304]|uniref:CASTOR/POLLUX-related putative ion channel n=1 Tax=Streptomyces sp. NBC_01304 TaxID=2903818 RepID=UPI002E164F23|nr:NAD-binding lipoprotein [Streptomyces sp. NBC_01304]
MGGEPSPRARLRYWFDNTMSRGTPALIGWLSAICLVIVIPVSALLVWADKNTPTTLGNQLVSIWKNTAKTFALGGPVGTPLFVLFSIVLALVGLFFASTLVGLITAGVNRKILDLRKGRSVVLEKQHTVLLGWSDQVFPIVSELVEANSNLRRSAVVILADKDKVEMEDEIHAKVPHTGTTRVICRTGSPMDTTDIHLTNPDEARSIIVLAPPPKDPEAAQVCASDDSGDAEVVKTLLAITQSPQRREQPYHIVAAVQCGHNREAARLAGGAEACVAGIDDISARLIVQTSRQPGLSVIYMDLLNYAGDEFYMCPEPTLTGRTYGDALLAYDTSSPAGLLRAADGAIVLNPAPDTVIAEGDQIIAVSRDDDTVIVSDFAYEIDEAAIVTPRPREIQPDTILVLGWNRRAATIISQLDTYVAAGSRLHVVARGAEAKGVVEAARTELTNLEVSCETGDITRPRTLKRLDIGGYDHVIVLGYDDIDTGRADNQTLVTLLHLRDLENTLGRELPVVTEMADDRNRALAPISEGDDFIVSDKVISLLMTQVSENRHLARLFDDLFAADGCEIYLKPAGDYVALQHDIDFYTVVESARRQGHSAIGYRLQAEAALPPSFGIRLNPDKKERLSFGVGDSVIVMAES